MSFYECRPQGVCGDTGGRAPRYGVIFGVSYIYLNIYDPMTGSPHVPAPPMNGN